jgi:hypothetical protein
VPTTTLTEEQVLWFRARRGHLAGPGAADVVTAAQSILGAQSQQLPPSLHALSLRTKGRPTATQVKTALLDGAHTLVRTWGQRGTLHVYDPADWAHVVSARNAWEADRAGPFPSEAAVTKALALIEKADEPITRTDLLPVVPKPYVREISALAERANLDPTRLAAGRLIWVLTNRGQLCLADKVGSEQRYALRSAWHPKAWPKKPPATAEANVTLSRRYLAVYGPATPKDVAHFFGAKITVARTWLAAIEDELAPVACGDRKELLALKEDLPELRKKPPTTTTGWPLRLLPLWESMLMGHADKSWITPDEADRKRVWRKAAYVAAVALDRGRIVANWTQKVKRKRLVVDVEPLSRWRKTKHAAGVKREAQAVAAHLELEGADVTFG